MPTLCAYANCRNRAPRSLFCSAHKTCMPSNPANNANMCTHLAQRRPITKNMCQHCYMKMFPQDPLTFQLTYKSAFVATTKFVQNRFDGFVANDHTSSLSLILNGITLLICMNKTVIQQIKTPTQMQTKTQYIYFGTGKYWNTVQQKYVNPMLYTRLYDLESEINKCIEFILMGEIHDLIYLFDSAPEAKLEAINFSK